MFNDLLMSLLSFPFDRLRLVSGLGAHAKEISNRQDLQEEETRQMLMAPAEHRSSYLAPPPQQQQQAVYHQSPHRGESEGVGVAQGGPQNQADLHQAEYAGGPQGELPMETGAGLGPVEGTAMAEPAGSGAGSSSGSSTGLQTRGDLPAVRALNVKCEKNHMTVSVFQSNLIQQPQQQQVIIMKPNAHLKFGGKFCRSTLCSIVPFTELFSAKATTVSIFKCERSLSFLGVVCAPDYFGV